MIPTILTEAVLAATRTAPTVPLTIAPGLQAFSSKIAFALVAVWLLYVVGQYVMPGRQRGRVQWTKLVWVVFGAIVLMDLSLIKTFADWFLQLGWWIGSVTGAL